MICETCGIECEKRFCNRICANKYSTKFQTKMEKQGECEECKVKIGKSKNLCKSCKEKFMTNKRNNHYKKCIRCGIEKNLENSFWRKGDEFSYYSLCKDCSCFLTKERYRRFKQQCVDYKGGKCCKCGYNSCLAALEFHHLNPEGKDFNISAVPTKKMTQKVMDELDKCELVCSNCHRAIHYYKYI